MTKKRGMGEREGETEGEELLRLRRENRSLSQRVEVLEGQRTDLKVINRHLAEAQITLAGLDPWDLTEAMSLLLRAGARSMQLTQLVQRWMSGGDLSPRALGLIGLPVEPLDPEERLPERREERWREEQLVSRGEREAARGVLPLLLSLREAAFKLSDLLSTDAPSQPSLSPEETLALAEERAKGLRKAVDCVAVVLESIAEEPNPHV